jgi:succinate dehydrogenase/fumarate reductase cytochrome b subunit
MFILEVVFEALMYVIASLIGGGIRYAFLGILGEKMSFSEVSSQDGWNLLVGILVVVLVVGFIFWIS